jgi:hypothetical protein
MEHGPARTCAGVASAELIVCNPLETIISNLEKVDAKSVANHWWLQN